jgi:SAM-dependent methyltransferase
LSFEVSADAYDRFMGRYSALLAPGLAELAEVRAGQSVLDVGCGPGALSVELLRRLGPARVAAVDPSSSFVESARLRLPGVDVRQAAADRLPFESGRFDAALAQLVFHFVPDPVAAAREMARVTRPGGVVAASVWDFAGHRAPVSSFWTAARELDATVRDESALSGGRRGHLAEIFRAAGLGSVESTELAVAAPCATFEEWWEPFTFGVGPAGAYARQVGEQRLSLIRERCRAKLGPGPFELHAVAWAARGSVRR